MDPIRASVFSCCTFVFDRVRLDCHVVLITHVIGSGFSQANTHYNNDHLSVALRKARDMHFNLQRQHKHLDKVSNKKDPAGGSAEPSTKTEQSQVESAEPSTKTEQPQAESGTKAEQPHVESQEPSVNTLPVKKRKVLSKIMFSALKQKREQPDVKQPHVKQDPVVKPEPKAKLEKVKAEPVVKSEAYGFLLIRLGAPRVDVFSG